jgi:hypothetical protein
MAIQSRPQVDETVAQEKLIERTSKDFTDGVCSGYLTYYNQYQDKHLVDLDVYAFIIQNNIECRVQISLMLATAQVGLRH